MITKQLHLMGAFQQFARSGRSSVARADNNTAVIYTRVSGKRQFETNVSVETQRNIIEKYAEDNGITILEYFGQTYESAKTDDRKEFNRMIEFIKKSKGRVSKVLVYKTTRFSRTGGRAIALKDELLEKYGVSLVAVTEPIDTRNPNGVLFQDMQLIFGRWDNMQRKEAAIDGMKAKFEKGIWVVRVPQGYDIVKTNGERKIVVNETGKLIRKAFDWKPKGYKNDEIVMKLQALGVNMYKQKLTKIFANPFYCGILSHKMLAGKVVEGTHEKMITKETFLKINEIRQGAPKYGVSHLKENNNLPMKIFLKCAKCKRCMTGYMIKSKDEYFYYKCRTAGCNNSRKADKVHSQFIELLANYTVQKPYHNVIRDQIADMFYKANEEKAGQEIALKRQLTEVTKKIEMIAEKHFVLEQMSRELFDQFHKKYNSERDRITAELERYEVQPSNLEKGIKYAMDISGKLHEIWTSGNLGIRERLQKLVFPCGIYYDGKNKAVLTSEPNIVFGSIARLAKVLADTKKGTDPFLQAQSLCAESEGFEPSIPVTVYALSKRARSATLTTLLMRWRK